MIIKKEKINKEIKNRNLIFKFKKLCFYLFLGVIKFCFQVVIDVQRKKKRGIIVFLISVIVFFLWGFSSALFWLLFLSFLVYGWENRIFAFLALVFLIFCPILIYLGKEIMAEKIAIWAFFFLVMSVVLQMVEFKKIPKIYRGEINPIHEVKIKKRRIMNDIVLIKKNEKNI